MPTEGQPQDDAVILHQRAYRETSLLVDVFTPQHGRFRVLAKGAKRGRSPLAPVLAPFRPVRLSWSGRGELPVLCSAEASGPAFCLSGTALFCGFYLNELLTCLLPGHDACAGLFREYLDALQRLSTGAGLQETLRYFEVALLDETGYGLRLDRDSSGRDIEPGKAYSYGIESGAAEVPAGSDGAVSGATLLGLARRRLNGEPELREARHLMRGILHHYLNGRRLKSRDLFLSSRFISTHERNVSHSAGPEH